MAKRLGPAVQQYDLHPGRRFAKDVGHDLAPIVVGADWRIVEDDRHRPVEAISRSAKASRVGTANCSCMPLLNAVFTVFKPMAMMKVRRRPMTLLSLHLLFQRFSAYPVLKRTK